MGTIRSRLAVLALTAVLVAACASRAPTQPTVGAPATAPPATAPSTVPGATDGTQAAGPSPAEAVATALAFMHREVRMRDPVAGPFRWTGRTTGEVGVRPRLPEDDASATGPVTVVSLQRLTRVWYVAGTRTANIRVAEPRPSSRIVSPVLVAGSALAFEGGVQVRVTQDRYGTDIVLGTGYVTGGGDVRRPFSGRVSFRRPSGPTGSVVFSELSEADGRVLNATVVRVSFGTPARRPFPGVWDIRTWEAAERAQRVVDEGHQPWRLDPRSVVTAWAEQVLLPGPEPAVVRQADPHTFEVGGPGAKVLATVQVTQPLRQGPTGIWVVTRIDRFA